MINIATALSASSKTWVNTSMPWADLVYKLTSPIRVKATREQYIDMSKREQSALKDVGGYVGGYLKDGKRNKTHIISRYLITLDVDYATTTFWDTFKGLFPNTTAVLHQTLSHTERNPRFRLIAPLNRAVTPDEYQAISRKIAGALGIDLFDPTTFQAERLMYWPAVLQGMNYYHEYQNGDPIDADAVLAEYFDWKDAREWPTMAETYRSITAGKRQEDPREKTNVVGTFCRTYSISACISAYLSDKYEPAGEGRYTYIGGTTAAGVVVYDDLFSYSHHATDPSSGELCNAFDLIRLHRFSALDANFRGETHNSPSYKAMLNFATNDPLVAKTLGDEAAQRAETYFSDILDGADNIRTDEDDKDLWKVKLKVNKKGTYEDSAYNINLIFDHDDVLKDAFKYNEFEGIAYVMRDMPWRKLRVKNTPEGMEDVDFSGARNYIDYAYGITSAGKINDAMALAAVKRSFHPVRDYLDTLLWDGVSRIDTLLIDYFSAEDNAYTREAIRKMLVAAVARIYHPGTKFDYMLVLIGLNQAEGKSTFVKKLGKGWSSDSLTTMSGKEAYEQLRGLWLIESAELSALKKTEVENIKNFISKPDDRYRSAYARYAKTYPRQCVFFGTTNDMTFLKDPTGDRRFMPILVKRSAGSKSVFSREFDNSIDQIWAEAKYLYTKGEQLILSDEANEIADIKRSDHTVRDERFGLITEYLETHLPGNWDEMDLMERKLWLKMSHKEKEESDAIGKFTRDSVCSLEIFCEVLEKDIRDVDRRATKDINEMLRSVPGWQPATGMKTHPIYGRQRYYERIKC